MAWVFYALFAAALWGGYYLIYEVLLKSISAPTVLSFSTLGASSVFLCWLIIGGSFEKDWQQIRKGGDETWLLVGAALLAVMANVAFLSSMRLKNATISGLIEITYPLFTALFAWIFIREAQMSLGTLLGACFIMTGIICIYYFEKTV